jgi:hypothetical protein
MNTRLDFSDKHGMKRAANDNQKIGKMRPLDRSDPRNPDHPCQKANWLALASELGRAVAASEWQRLYGESGEGSANDNIQPTIH